MNAFEGHASITDRYVALCRTIDLGLVVTFIFVYDCQTLDPDGLPTLVYLKDIRDVPDLDTVASTISSNPE